MARSRTRSTRSQASSRTSGSRRAPAPVATEEAAEGGLGVDAGMAIITTVVLLVAILFLDYELGTHYGGGIFFK